MATYSDSYSLPRQTIRSSLISIVDILFPGLTNISAAIQQLHVGHTNHYAQMICISGIILLLGKYAYKYLKAFVETYFTYTIHVSDSSEAYDMLVTWVSSQPFAYKASSALATVGPRRRGLANDHSDENQKKLLRYSLWKGAFFFWYKWHLCIYQTMQSSDRYYAKEEVSVSCIGMSPAILRDLFSECRTEYLKLVKNKTSIFENNGCDWKLTNTVDIRELDTVILSREKKTALLDDIKYFLNPESRAWYTARGIPYGRGYLLYGPAGTGKSSLSLSIAGECELDVYMLSLAGVDDFSLRELFAGLPPRCVVLLEDVDAATCTHSRQRDVTPRKESGSFGKRPGGELSLSALLNAINGVGSQQGRLLIMTTNHIEHLDAALIRPGRIDMKLKLELTTRDVNAQLFASIFRKSNRDEGKAESEKAKQKMMLMQQAADFAREVPEYKFSPADIQQFLMRYRQSPGMAVQKVREWVEQNCHSRENPQISEESRNNYNETALSDKLNKSATTEYGAQDEAHPKEIATAIAPAEIHITKLPHCCTCHILQDAIGKLQEKEILTIEEGLFLTYLSSFDVHLSSHGSQQHSARGLLNLLLDFVKKIYPPSSVGRYSIQPAVPLGSPTWIPTTASDDSSTLVQPTAVKFGADLKLKLAESQLLGPGEDARVGISFDQYLFGNMQIPAGDEKGLKAVSADSSDASPDLSYYFRPPSGPYSDATFSDISPDGSATGTSFESESEFSCGSIAEGEVDEIEVFSGLGAKRRVYRQPDTPPALVRGVGQRRKRGVTF